MVVVKSNIDYAKVTSASGGWTIADTSVSLSNRMGSMVTAGTQAIDYKRNININTIKTGQ